MEYGTSIQMEIERLISQLKLDQKVDGSWRYPFETGSMTDSYMIFLLRTLYTDNDSEASALIPQLAQRLIATQSENGAWKQYDDDNGHLSSTIEAYTALLLSGYRDRSDDKMKLAEDFILQHGGIENAHLSTKFTLALHRLYPWPSILPIPFFLIHLPRFLSISFHRWSSYARSHFASILILGAQKFSIHHSSVPDLTHLYTTTKYLKLARQMYTTYGCSTWKGRRAKSAIKKQNDICCNVLKRMDIVQLCKRNIFHDLCTAFIRLSRKLPNHSACNEGATFFPI